ncbi:MAG: OmpA family protein, partial [Alphaproteobacteria bacterium]|nr:OmpA family protein [Alphaproteobacteria bacterium]
DRVAQAERMLIIAAARRALGRAEPRLRQALPEIDRLEAAIGGAARRADLKEVGTALEGTLGDVASLRDRLSAGSSASGAPADLVSAINRSRASVTQLIGTLATIFNKRAGGGAQAGPAGTDASGPAAAGLVEAAEDLASQSERLATLLLALNQTAAMIPPPLPPQKVVISQPMELTAEEKLKRFIDRHAIFFSNGTDFADAQRAGEILDQAAALIKAGESLVRVAGYTDERGDSVRNDKLAQDRATVVVGELVRRGVPADRLVGIGRAGGFDLSPGSGALSPNRRVQFELGYQGEARGGGQ